MWNDVINLPTAVHDPVTVVHGYAIVDLATNRIVGGSDDWDEACTICWQHITDHGDQFRFTVANFRLNEDPRNR